MGPVVFLFNVYKRNLKWKLKNEGKNRFCCSVRVTGSNNAVVKVLTIHIQFSEKCIVYMSSID